MNDLISRQEAIDILSEMQGIVSEDGIRKGISLAWQQIKELPPAQPEPKNGKWIDLKCNQCGQVDMSKPNFCSNCGADMRGERDDSD